VLNGGRDPEPGVERDLRRGARPRDEPGEGGGEAVARARRPRQGDEVEPAVGVLRGERDPLVGRGRCDELDAVELVMLVDGQVGDDQARCARGPGVRVEPLVAVGLEQRRVGHRHERHVDALTDLREALEAGGGPHPAGECPLRRPPDDGPIGERVGEREAELDDIGAALDGRLGELGRVPSGHQVDDEGLHSPGRREKRVMSDRPPHRRGRERITPSRMNPARSSTRSDAVFPTKTRASIRSAPSRKP
jgi:hypothetical protein